MTSVEDPHKSRRPEGGSVRVGWVSVSGRLSHAVVFYCVAAAVRQLKSIAARTNGGAYESNTDTYVSERRLDIPHDVQQYVQTYRHTYTYASHPS